MSLDQVARGLRAIAAVAADHATRELLANATRDETAAPTVAPTTAPNEASGELRESSPFSVFVPGAVMLFILLFVRAAINLLCPERARNDFRWNIDSNHTRRMRAARRAAKKPGPEKVSPEQVEKLTFSFNFGGVQPEALGKPVSEDTPEETSRDRRVSTSVRDDVDDIDDIDHLEELDEADADEACAICIDPFELGDRCRRLPCGHFYHGECVDEWFQRSCECPLCKQDIRNSQDHRSIKLAKSVPASAVGLPPPEVVGQVAPHAIMSVAYPSPSSVPLRQTVEDGHSVAVPIAVSAPNSLASAAH